MRLQTYDYEIVYVPGKNMLIADALSRAILGQEGPGHGFDVVNTVSATDLTADVLRELQNAIEEDEQRKKLLMVIRQGWPQQKSSCDPMLAPYWDVRGVLSLCDDVVLKGLFLVISRKLRAKHMRLTHNAHMGADACLRRARGSIFWPRMTSDLRVMVEK